MKLKVGVSNRHVHLTEEVYNYLFDNKKIEKKFDLKQKGEFASTDCIDLEHDGKIIEHVRVLGPFRNACQVELLKRDLDYLGLPAPTRKSGDLAQTPGIALINGERRYVLQNGVIRAQRHVHISFDDALKYGFTDGEKILLKRDDIIFDASIKASSNGYMEVHIDKDEAEEYGLSNGDEVEVKCGKLEMLK